VANDGALEISFLRLEDSGVYQCSAENSAGEIVGYTWLKVKSERNRSAENPNFFPFLGDPTSFHP